MCGLKTGDRSASSFATKKLSEKVALTGSLKEALATSR
jgi:hypothetical protein